MGALPKQVDKDVSWDIWYVKRIEEERWPWKVKRDEVDGGWLEKKTKIL